MKRRQMVCEARTGKLRPAFDQTPLLSSASSPWCGWLLEHHSIGAFDLVDVSLPQHVAAFRLHTAANVDFEWEGRRQTVRIQPGEITLFPAHVTHTCRCAEPSEFISLSMENEFLACAAAEFDRLPGVELAPKIAFQDPLIYSICLAMKAELEAGCPGGRLYGETLATMVAVHLAHRYSTQSTGPADRQGGLAKYQLRAALDYIKDRVAEDVSLKQLAGHVGVSPFHFARMFKRSTGLAPHQYLMKYRVERARQLMLRPGTSIADVAAQLGFCDQSHLASHFKRVYGVTPKRFLREKVTSNIIGRKTAAL